jgi:uncharacterized ion transporter superfamily protein YfcC
MIIETKIAAIYWATASLIGAISVWMADTFTPVTASEAESWTFKGFLFLAVVCLCVFILFSLRYVANMVQTTIKDCTSAFNNNSATLKTLDETLKEQNAWFKNIGVRAIEDAMSTHKLAQTFHDLPPRGKKT